MIKDKMIKNKITKNKITNRTMIVLYIITIFYISAIVSTAASSEDTSCAHCHSREAQEYQKSVHYDKVSCADCHGGDIKINGTVSTDSMYKNFTGIPDISVCSKCHNDISELYKDSIHFKTERGATCVDCHSYHKILSYKDSKSVTYYENVPLLCSGCHENQTRMQAWYYGIETDRFDTYKKSYHYKAIILGSKEKGFATCPDCHENHNTKNENDPTSTIYPTNLVNTCEKSGCHSEQKALIYGGKVHEGQSINLYSIDIKKLVTYFYIVMILFELVFTLGLIYLDIYSKIDIRKRHTFTINQRIEHIIFFVTFILLAYTGFPLKFPDEWWSKWMIASVGGFDNRTLIHHISGLIMLGVGAYHIIYHVLLEKPRFDILFNPNDIRDIKQHIKYLLKKTNDHPKFGRYTWKQKFEYFGAGFGILIMGFTGMLMWNPFEAMKYFPIGFIQIANLFHTWEAVLASLAIFIGHLYDEHLGKFLNMSWLTGIISEKEMRHEHPAEYMDVVDIL